MARTGTSLSLDKAKLFAECGVDTSYGTRGGLTAQCI
jgi:hypothetical protein